MVSSIVLFLCSDGMRFFYLFGQSVVVITIASVFFATVLLIRATPPKGTLRRYSFGAKMRLILPFDKRWRERVAPEHFEALQKFRIRLFTWWLVFYTCMILRIAYFNVLGPRVLSLFSVNQCIR